MRESYKSSPTSDQPAPPRVAILATGGTIAGVAGAGDRLTGYASGILNADELVASVPALGKYARISTEQIANIDSSRMSITLWLKLANRINELLAGDVDGVVVTHGTDTLEETAYFLNLVVKSAKPVVMVGAMRPATAISADGPLNLLEAVVTAASPGAAGKGVLVAMNGIVCGARSAAKMNTQRVDAFRPVDIGCLGYVVENRPVFYKAPSRRHTINSEFDVSGLDSLPKVEIVYSYVDAGSEAVLGVLAAKPAGIVSGGVGDGRIAPTVEAELRRATAEGVAVVRSSRVATGVITRSTDDETNHFVAADNLSPQKARVLLMLALTRTTDPHEIQRMFLEY